MTGRTESSRHRRLLALVLLSAAGCGSEGSDRAASGELGSQRATDPALETANGLAGLVQEHVARYPEMEVQDLYKLIYQASNGNVHALQDTVAARSRLEEELASLRADSRDRAGQQADEPLTERLSPEGGLVRVNLRPYLAAGGDEDALWRAFVRTARKTVPSLDSLRVWWSEVEALAADGALPFAADALRSFYVRQGLTGFPVPHHSSHYLEVYRPAYRVMAADALRLPGR